MNDPIVDKVRRVRDERAARFDYDLNAIFRDIKEREKKSGLKFVAGVARKSMPNEALIKYVELNRFAVDVMARCQQQSHMPVVQIHASHGGSARTDQRSR